MYPEIIFSNIFFLNKYNKYLNFSFELEISNFHGIVELYLGTIYYNKLKS